MGVRVAGLMVIIGIQCCPLLAGEIAVPGDAPDLAAALDRAQPGDTIHLGAGEFAGDFVVSKPVTIKGISREETRIVGKETTLTVEADVGLESLTVVGVATGVLVKAGRHLEAVNCAFTDAKSDGIGFENSTDTTLELRKCLVTRNTDGVDLESTQGLIVDSEFIANRDDGLDYDGDARVTCVACRFKDNGDDGVEIRLRDTTEAVFSRCEFSGNREDGLEIINSPVERPACNVLVLGHNKFTGNERWGVGFVTSYKPEEAKEDDRTKAVVLWGPNEFEGNGSGSVSPNHVKEMERAQPTAETVTIESERPGEEARQFTVPMRTILPVATISLRPALGGGKASDLEGVTVLGTRLFAADDNTPGIHEVDLRTKAIVRTLKTKPFPDTDLTVGGAEGLSVSEWEGKPALLLSADDENLVLTLDAAEDGFGKILDTRDVKGITSNCEGIERVGDRLFVAYGGRRVRVLDAEDYQPIEGMTFALKPVGFGRHIAGVGFDGERVLLTASAYTGKKVHTQNSLLISLDPETCEPTEAWHIPYLDDPRGVTWANGLAWVVDGMSPYTDAELGIRTAAGIRALVFALSPEASEALRLRDLPGPWFGK